MNPVQGTYFLSLEKLRGIAALLIFLHHIPHWYRPLSSLTFLTNSYLMVELFFVLSGFIIYLSYSERITDLPALIDFHILRIGRLYPVHMVFLLAFAALETLKWAMAPDSLIPAFSRNGMREFIENATLTQALGFSQNAASFNSPSWSISVEFYTYAIFSLAILFFRKRIALIAFMAICIAATILLAMSSSELSGFRLILRCLAGFFLGCIIAEAHIRTKFVRLSSENALLFLTFLSMILFLQFKIPEDNQVDFCFSVLSGILVILLVKNSTGGDQPKGMSVLSLLGTLSYSLYMTHYLIIYVFDVWLHRYSGLAKQAAMQTRYSNGRTFIDLSTMEALIIYPALVGSTIVIAWLIHKLVEVPARSLVRMMVKTRKNRLVGKEASAA
jgi:peptidoglycan/LPS O-acetylase OafA/YrhL